MIISTEKEKKEIYKGCQYIKKLNFQDNSQNKVFYDKNGNLKFVGSVLEEQRVQWKNLYTGSLVKDELYVDRPYIMKNGAQEYRGEFVATKTCDKDKVIFVDLNPEQLRKAKSYYTDLMFHITQCAEINSIQKMDAQGAMHDFLDMRQWEAFSRIRIHCFNNNNENEFHIEKFKQGLEIEQKSHMILYDSDLQFAYYPDEQKLLFKNKILTVDCGAVRELMITCRSNQITKEMIPMEGSTISILDNKGYVYLEPFSLQEELSGLKVVIIASRKMELEIYDNKAEIWKKFECNQLNTVKKSQKIQLRIRTRFGDRIHEAAIVR